jgi:RNA polymerase sigma-70 factor (ECF subfamily)
MTNAHHFEAFMRAYQDMVYTTAVRLLGNEADAEDIAQGVFLKAYERFEEIAHSPTAGGWLRTVAKNLSLNHLSRYRARWRFFSEMASQDGETEYENWLPAPDIQSQPPAEADRYQFLEEALAKLPDSQRVPLVLYHFDDMRYEDIAERLGVSLSKVKMDIHRGRQALYRQLKGKLAREDIGVA